jgi:hypothetical protein
MGKSVSAISVIALSAWLANAAPVFAQADPIGSIEPAPPGQPVVAAPLPTTSLFESIGHDFKNFVSIDTAKTLGVFGAAALAAKHWDGASVEEAAEGLTPHAYHAGDLTGSMYIQGGAAVATFALGKISGHQEIASLGVNLIRAQILAQAAVQGLKFAAERQRPDASNSLSFPSGHAASAFATATVVQQTFGWKAGAPAYALAAFVADSRMAGRKHYLSDVVFGAGIGIAAGRTVTIKLRGAQFDVGATPLPGGAAVMFTKR